MSLSSYKEQRFERLSDVVIDYLDDETASAEKFLQDLNRSLEEWRDYHHHRLSVFNKVLDRIQDLRQQPDIQG